MSVSASSAKPARKAQPAKRSTFRQILGWLGSMALAITLLVVLGLASIIGTVLQQNQPFNDYLIKFGPFWFEIFDALRLYDVYSAWWFVVILVFLLASTSLCVWRNAPTMLRDIKNFRTGVQEKSLRAFKHSDQWESDLSPDDLAGRARDTLAEVGYQSRLKSGDDHVLVAAKKGGMNRWGYILTHVGLIIILIGGVMDSKLQLQWLYLTDNLQIETRDLSVSQIGEESKIPPGTSAFRGNVNIPEGGKADVVFLGLRDGYLVQELPFEIEVQDFRIDYYDNGMPKAYESDLVLTDNETGEVIEQTIGVNHPLIHRGHAIYQASFADGGTHLDFKAWQLGGRAGSFEDIETRVFRDVPFQFAGERFTLEFDDFRLYNINPVEGDDGETEQRNFGPSVVFKLRDETGVATEYENFMSPVPLEGNMYYLSGIRTSPDADQQYLYIPADRNGKIDTFMGLLAALHDRDNVKRVAGEMVAAMQASQGNPVTPDQIGDSARESIARLVDTFLAGGFGGVEQDLRERMAGRNLDEAQMNQAIEASIRVLQSVITRIFGEVMIDQGIEEPVDDDLRILEESLAAISALPAYRSPIYLQMTGFEQVQATGLQITRSPGKSVVYFGSLMLVAGVFMLFYIHYRRQWVWIRRPEGERTQVLLVGNSGRKSLDFDREFAWLKQAMRERSQPASDQTG
ncbi:MAG: cytochrome c biogenesis protein ResB [Halothiobacillaceae bacterium]